MVITDQFSDVRIRIVNHCMFEGLEEVFLELEVRKFLFLEEPRCQLTKRVQCKRSHMRIVMTAHLQKLRKRFGYKIVAAYLIEVFSKDIPEIGPFETNSVHVIIRNFDQLLQAEHTWVLRQPGRLYFLPRDITECLDKVNDGSLNPYNE